jgi:hypothetical protein
VINVKWQLGNDYKKLPSDINSYGQIPTVSSRWLEMGSRMTEGTLEKSLL